MRSSNPIFNRDFSDASDYSLSEVPMTVGGTMNKLMLLSVLLLVAAAAVYYQFSIRHLDYVQILGVAGIILGIILSIIISVKPKTSPYLAPIYAFAEGAALSFISCFFEAMYPGIVIQAISTTFLVVLAMGVSFQTGLIKATEKFRATIVLATLTIGILYLISFILMLFHVNIPYFTSTSIVSIVLNFVIAVIAALNLILDFDFIDKGSKSNLPAVFEWYGAFGLLVTIVWLYIEILRLLARLQSRK